MIADLGPMGVHIRLAVVVFHQHGGNRVLIRVAEGRDVPFHHGQQVQGEVFHAIDAGTVHQKPLFIPDGLLYRLLHNLRRIPGPDALTIPVLRNELLDIIDLSVSPTAFGNARAAFFRHFRDDLFRQGVVGGLEASGSIEIVGVTQNKVHVGIPGQVFVDVEAAGKGIGHGCQHHGQGQGKDGYGGFALAAAQIRPGHPGEGRAALCSPDLLPFPGLLPAALCVPERFHRRDLRGHASGLCAGEEDRGQREQRRAHENPGIEGDNKMPVVHMLQNKYCHAIAYQKTGQQSKGNPDQA